MERSLRVEFRCFGRTDRDRNLRGIPGDDPWNPERRTGACRASRKRRSFSHPKVVAWVSLIGVGLFSATAHAATVWDEAANGDLSNDGLAPTPLVAGVGSNVILGATGNRGQGVDRDYFKFTVPAGAALTQIILLPNTSVSGSVSFIGMQSGPELTVTPSGGGVERLLALGHYGNDQIGTDLLPAIKLGSPGPLPSGTYSVWVQDTGGPASYGFDFVVTSLAPAASAPALRDWGVLLLGLLLPISYLREVARLQARRAKALAAAHRGC